MEKYLREPINGLTHFIGAVLSLFALIAMLVKAYVTGSSAITFGSVLFFGVSMILLYSASATYHSVKASDKVIKDAKKTRSFNDIYFNCRILCSILLSSTKWKNRNKLILSCNNMCSCRNRI